MSAQPEPYAASLVAGAGPHDEVPMALVRRPEVDVALAPAARDAADLAACKAILAQGSKSFAAASLLLPRRVREPAAAFYAFCRLADDEVDLAEGPAARVEALGRLSEQVARLYAGRPADHPMERALSRVIAAHGLPRVAFDALLEGFAWDAEGRRYEELSGVLAYSARVASAVGVAMTALMGPRDPETLARACDLGLAMQLTNIARDVGEDARAGRVYLPLSWLREAGIDPDVLADRPVFTPALGAVTARLLDEADTLYRAADRGIARLPADCRISIRAASLIYGAIGRELRRAGCDAVSRRVRTSALQKVGLVLRALPARLWRAHTGTLPVRTEVRFLVEGARVGGPT